MANGESDSWILWDSQLHLAFLKSNIVTLQYYAKQSTIIKMVILIISYYKYSANN